MKSLSKIFDSLKRAAQMSGAPRKQLKLDARKLACEELEDRCLLSVTPLEYQAIQEAFSDFNLAQNIKEVNTIDIDELSAVSFKQAIQNACATLEDDLIVLRASQDEFISFAKSFNGELSLNVDYDFGAVNVVGIDDSGANYDPLDLIDFHDYTVYGKGGYINGEYFYSLPDDNLSDEATYLSALASTSMFTQSWHKLINLDDYYKDTRFSSCDGSGYSIVIIDTGINASHDFFKDNYGNSRIVYQHDFYFNDDIAEDVMGHGTHVAGLAAGNDNLYSGVASGADIIVLKVFGNAGGAPSSAISSALNWTIQNASEYNIASVNMSLGYGNFQTEISGSYNTEINTLIDSGVAVCIASGNDFYEYKSVQGVASPACVNSAICVGAVHSSGEYYDLADSNPVADQISYFTQRKSNMMDLFAPGVNMWSAGTSGDMSLAKMSGTSMACPVVAGCFAVAQSLATYCTGSSMAVNDMLQLMQNTAVTIYDGDDEDTDYTTPTYSYYKRIDLYNLAKSIYITSNSLYRIGLSNYAPQYGDVINSYISKSSATVTYQWAKSMDGTVWENIEGATSSSYTTALTDVGYYIKATATGTGAYEGAFVYAQTNHVVTAPITGISITCNEEDITSHSSEASLVYMADTDTILNAALTPKNATAKWQWFRGKSLNGSFSSISGATSSSYILAGADAGYYLRVAATGTGSYTGTFTETTVFVTCGLNRIEFTNGKKEDEENETSQDVSFDVGNTIYTELIPTFAEVVYSWYRSENQENWTLIEGQTADFYTISESDQGCYFKVIATANGGKYTGTVEAVSNEKVDYSINVDFDAKIPVVRLPFTASINTALDDFTCQWYTKDSAEGEWTELGNSFSKADLTSKDGYHYSISYTPISEMVGKFLKLEVNGSELLEDNNTPKYSGSAETTDPIVEYYVIDHVDLSSLSPFTNIELKATVYSPNGSILEETEGNSDLVITYKWYRSTNKSNWTIIESANDQNTYTPTDQGYYIKVEVTGSEKCQGTAFAVTTATVLDKLETVTFSTDTPTVNNKITAVPNTHAFDNTLSWQWYRSTDAEGSFSAIEGATSSTYTPVEDDLDKYLRVIATSTDETQDPVSATTTAPVTQALSFAQFSTSSPKLGEQLSVTVYPSEVLEKSGAAYTWFRYQGDGSETDLTLEQIENTTSSYTVSNDDINCYLKVIVQGTNGYSGTITIITTAKAAAKITAVSLNSESEFKVGSTVSTKVFSGNSIIEGDDVADITYEWYRGTMEDDPQSETGTKFIIKEAINNIQASYELTKDDLGFYIGVAVQGGGKYSGYAFGQLMNPVTSDTEAILNFDPETEEDPVLLKYGQTLTLKANESIGMDLDYYWDLYGNGKGIFTQGNEDGSATFDPSINILKDGDYTVRLKVIDNYGVEKIASKTIRVFSDLQAVLESTYVFEAGTFNTISAEKSSGEEIRQYYWDLGNGFKLGEKTVEFPADRETGQYEIKLKIVDSRKNESIATAQVTVATFAPTVSFDKKEFNDSRLVSYSVHVVDSIQNETVSEWRINWGDQKEDEVHSGVNSYSFNILHYYAAESQDDQIFNINLKIKSSTNRWSNFSFSLGSQLIKGTDPLDASESSKGLENAISLTSEAAPVTRELHDYAAIIMAENAEKEKFNFLLATLENDSIKSDSNLLQDDFLNDLELNW